VPGTWELLEELGQMEVARGKDEGEGRKGPSLQEAAGAWEAAVKNGAGVLQSPVPGLQNTSQRGAVNKAMTVFLECFQGRVSLWT
jgi:hypothetical protein